MTSPAVTPSSTARQAGIAAEHARIAPPGDYVPLTPEGLLLFCQGRLQGMDGDIARKMKGQNDLVALQGRIANISSSLQAGGKGAEGDKAFDDPEKIAAVSKQLDDAIAAAEATGNPAVAKTLHDVQAKLHAGGDNIVLVDEVKTMGSLLDNAMSNCRSGAEVSMIELQSLVSQRATVLQLTTGMMNSINESSKSIAANIGRG